ncbi:helix-turn-helix transcriptional regulator [Paenibacillus filicis]|uniref:Helix-turn-helix transcriptional regulator n=1 Tax=Paenibacillus gyeongsangnamensis TaxID=3388067 RepID=A0ABT4Q883_9BACL|nr:helix-turn-helix transcriptional regulator [Paenibacillus filicis]MCZ8513031.1 helix-turn-helix transcriptional regulator [Paenibacillus filicis]
MTNDMSYTTEEIAKLLKVSKLTVYDLIKKGDLPAYRVGKQMRVDASDLDAYKHKAKGIADSGLRPIPHAASAAAIQPPAPNKRMPQLVITGQDISLDLLAKHLEKHAPGIRPLRSYVGSLDSLISMYRGESDIVSTHLIDGDTGEYNLPYVRKLLGGFSYTVIHLLSRSAGFYVAQGNPLGLQAWEDLWRPGLRLVNREIGSGARVLLDEQLRLHDIDPRRLTGYEHTESNHLGVAGKVASGEADVGVGIEKAAHIVGGVDFVPLIQESYDLVMLNRPENRDWMETVKRILRSESFHQELSAIQGYDLSRTGQVLLET